MLHKCQRKWSLRRCFLLALNLCGFITCRADTPPPPSQLDRVFAETKTVLSTLVVFPVVATSGLSWVFSCALAWWRGPAVLNVKCCSHLVAAVWANPGIYFSWGRNCLHVLARNTMNTLSQYRINARMPFRRTDTFSLLCSQLFSYYSIQARSYGSFLQFDLVWGLRAQSSAWL